MPGATPPMADLQNEFSWSKSRHEKFVECRRAYFYAYYGSWGGWEAAAGSPVRELYVLKKLSSRWQWAGSVVHDALKQMLSRARVTGDFLPLERVLERTRARARAQWAISREKSYWREASRIVGPRRARVRRRGPGEDWKRLYEGVVDGVAPRVLRERHVRGDPPHAARDRWLSVDELDSWQFEGTKIWVAIDFAYRDADGRVRILDWKTGKERGVDHTQVGIYALYAQRKWGVAARRAWSAGSSTSSRTAPARAATRCRSPPTGPRSSGARRRCAARSATMKAALAEPGAEPRARWTQFPQRPRARLPPLPVPPAVRADVIAFVSSERVERRSVRERHAAGPRLVPRGSETPSLPGATPAAGAGPCRAGGRRPARSAEPPTRLRERPGAGRAARARAAAAGGIAFTPTPRP